MIEFFPVKKIQSWFAETSTPIKYKEVIDTSTNDFNRQSLLINQFSYSGPCITKADLNKDGFDDMIIGGAAGESTKIFLQERNGSFVQKNIPALEQDKAYADAAIAVFDANADGHPDIYIASGGYNDLNDTDALLQDRLYLNDGNNNFIKSKTLPLLMAANPVYVSKT
jgi:hypothetical protein